MTHGEIHKTAKEILISWLNWRKQQGKRHIKNSDMVDCMRFGQKSFRQTYNIATYEREFRKLRQQYGWRFEDVSDEFRRREKTWKLKPKPKKKPQ